MPIPNPGILAKTQDILRAMLGTHHVEARAYAPCAICAYTAARGLFAVDIDVQVVDGGGIATWTICTNLSGRITEATRIDSDGWMPFGVEDIPGNLADLARTIATS